MNSVQPVISEMCFDRVLPANVLEHLELPGEIHVDSLVAPLRKQWINGTTLRVRFIGGTPEQHEIIKGEARLWEAHANLKFDFNNDPAAEIRISFENTGAWSYIGTDCASIPLDEPTMNFGFLSEGVAAHEFGHAIGLGHEHQNPAGGIQWNEDSVYRELGGPPNLWDKKTVFHNVIKKYSADQVQGTQFDPKSIMLYWFPPIWTLNGVSTSRNSKLSDLDKSFIGSAAMYPKPTMPAQQINQDQPRRTSASIRKPGEEDLFEFTVPEDKPGSYTINTQGKTNVVMRLFGPNSQTALIAEDDDSGLDENAEICSDLIPGKYFVQIRHSDAAGGVGRYSIKCFYSPPKV